jgi:O-antigen biosynthesis protein WbqP
MIKRIIDVLISIAALVVLAIPMILISILIKGTSRGPILYWSSRVGRDNKLFQMAKFRTMYIETPEVASDLLDNPKIWITSIGSYIRKSSLDELPQLINVLIGDMSIVGPRPALNNQIELIELRTKKNIHIIKPGITGLAQISGRDKVDMIDKIKLDEEYLLNRSILMDIKIILATVLVILSGKDVSH